MSVESSGVRPQRRALLIAAGLLASLLWVGSEARAWGLSFPDPPTGVSAVAVPRRTLTVHFTPPVFPGSSPIDLYYVRCSSVVALAGPTNAAYSTGSPVSLIHVPPNVPYECEVRARNTAGWGNYSAMSAPVSLPTVPSPPGIASAVFSLPRSVTVTVDPPSDDGGAFVDRYLTVCYADVKGAAINYNYTTPISMASNQLVETPTSMTMTRLTPGVTYECYSRAHNVAGWSAVSAASDPIVVPGVPDAPWYESIEFTVPRTVAVTLAAPLIDGGSPVTLYYTRCESIEEGAGATNGAYTTELSVTFTRLTPGVDYHCRFRARNAVGWSPNSAWSDGDR